MISADKQDIPVATEEETLEFFERCYSHRRLKIYSYYCSDFDKIITDERRMLIPIDQRMATRAHAVFDVVYIKRQRLINLEDHISRLLRSAKELCIECPLSLDRLRRIVKSVSKVALQQISKHSVQVSLDCVVLTVRMTLSSGHGDFGIASLNKQPTFYAAVSEPFINYEQEKQGVKEFVVKIIESPPQNINHPKSVSYAENAIMANESKKRGGYQGIKMTKDRVLLEAAVANIAFVFESGEFATPRFETVVKGTTISRCLIRLEQLIADKKLSKISFKDITQEEAYTARQMMVIGGDKIVPVLSFNDHPISQRKGPITEDLQSWYQSTLEQATSVYD